MNSKARIMHPERGRIVPFLIAAAALLLALTWPLSASGESEKEIKMSPVTTEVTGTPSETAVFAGGCFWGVEGVFEELDGVTDVVSGYSGGSAETAKYRSVGTGTTGHAESVRIEYDSDVISFEKLLEVFFIVAHDPTQLNYQGPDHGSEYRSVVFYDDEAQEQITRNFIAELERQNIYKEKIVTEVTPLDAFYPAEDYHQNFMANNPNYPYIVMWDKPKVEHLQEAYPELLKKGM